MFCTISRVGGVGAVIFFAIAASAAWAGTPVTVIDVCADLSHPSLQNNLNVNFAEKNGKPGVDDDHNGFVDDILGWNAKSNDSKFMPDWIMDIYKNNRDHVEQLLKLYNRIEMGDEAAEKTIHDHPEIVDALSAILETSHGTHVSGIVARFSQGAARLQNVNVKFPSKKPAEGLRASKSGMGPSDRLLADKLLADKLRGLVDATHLGLTDPSSSHSGARPSTNSNDPMVSIYDDRATLDSEFLKPLESAKVADSRLIRSYLVANHSRVVNVSMGTAIASYKKIAQGIWERELAEAGLNPETERSPLQQANFEYFIKRLWYIEALHWAEITTALPDVVFVVAAGNDGMDLDQYPTLPAFFAKTQPNVIAVAATDSDGMLADFSNYNAEQVTLGAWGVSVPSLAPAGLENVLMSGTSMASPVVAGVVSAMRDANPILTPAQIKTVLIRTTTPKGSLQGKTVSGGILNAALAIQTAGQLRSMGLDEVLAKNSILPDFRNQDAFLSRPDLGDGTQGRVFKTSEELKKFLPHW